MYKLIKPSKIAIDNGVTEPKTVLRLTDNAFIPFNLENADYQEYLKWLAEGNEPEPADE